MKKHYCYICSKNYYDDNLVEMTPVEPNILGITHVCQCGALYK